MTPVKNITMADVAREAGISRQAVSDILNDRNVIKVSDTTRDRVHRVVRELKYRPDYFAKSLKQGKTHCIGMLSGPMIADFRFPNVSATASGITMSMEARKSPYSLMIFGANYHEGYDQTINLIRKGLVDGLLIMIISLHLDEFEKVLLPVLREVRLPFVVIHSLSRPFGYNNVGLNAPLGTRTAVNHLAGLGYRDIRYYLRMIESSRDDELLDGFKAGMADAGLSFDDSQLLYPDVVRRSVLTQYKDAYDTALKMKDIPRAIVTSNDEQAIGLMRGFRARGMRVPEDVAIVANNQANPNKVFVDELTQIRHPFNGKATAAVNMLHDVLEGKREWDKVHQETLDPELLVRTSCGAGLKQS